MQNKQKRVLAIHDISCVGRCSLTVALPILSAAGLDTGVLPTAVLSTHTGGFDGFTYRDLTEDILPIANHWEALDLKFDALYSGFLGSYEQIDMVATVFEKCKKDGGLILVDPVMADNGKMYSIYSPEMAQGMKTLCSNADIIVPNLTEAAFLLGEEYRGNDYDEAYIEDTVKKLAKLGAKKIVLTGVSFIAGKLGAACYDSEADTLDYVSNNRIDGHFHGTGDIFGSALLSGIMRGYDLKTSAQIATDFALESIKECVKLNQEKRYGVAFERALPKLIKDLGITA